MSYKSYMNNFLRILNCCWYIYIYNVQEHPRNTRSIHLFVFICACYWILFFGGSNSKLIKIYAFILRSHMAEFNVLYLAHMELVIKICQFPLHNAKLVASGINPAFSSLRGMVDILPGQISHEVIRVLVSLNAFFFFCLYFY